MYKKIILSLTVILIVSVTAYIFNYTQKPYMQFSQGLRSYREHDYKKALPYFRYFYQTNPDNLENIFYLLQVYEKLDMQDDSIFLLEHLQAVKPRDVKLAEYLGDIYYSMDEYDKAEKVYRKILGEKRSVEVMRKLAQVLAWQKKYDQAVIALEYVISRDNGDGESRELLADIYVWVKDYDKAVALYKKLLLNKDESKDVLYKLAQALRFSGKNEEAIGVYKEYLNKGTN
ncbi:MAG: tetratricopeptide repeat protein [Candidatus Omnitrophica bacterium]|nr:tetratricopeptide repeat protein [Candidatus Omnitrophota bacterium]MDD5429683.1 tetratricopeptide repeat protein [Candidatus Omnitrophota bacterium]